MCYIDSLQLLELKVFGVETLSNQDQSSTINVLLL